MKSALISVAVLTVLASMPSKAGPVEDRLELLTRQVLALRDEVATLKAIINRDAATGNLVFGVAGSRNDLVNLHSATSIGASSTMTVGADAKTTIGRSSSTQIGVSRSTEIAKDDLLKVSGSVTHQVGSNMGVAVAHAIIIDAGDQITLKTGSASIVMKKNGEILFNGSTIRLEGSDDVLVKGAKILTN